MADDSERLEPGRSAFNRGEYFLAHELWEGVWRDVGEGERRTCVQGLIQIAAGLHHLQKHRSAPAAGLLRKGLEKVSKCRKGSSGGLRIDLLAGRMERLLVELDATRRETTEVTAGPDLRQIKL
jgi:predicted metal-dependent hydrolase